MRIRGRVVELEVDHRRVTYADFIKLVNELGGRVLFKDGFWPFARYRIALPKRRVRELLKILESEEALRSEGVIRISGS
ncbi:MAG: hypothetical protein DRK00_01270 [Thermoprotei archaeon]|nr:MAG: hypothetical protein DRK00_01270 [Thermoprotei archaeon]